MCTNTSPTRTSAQVGAPTDQTREQPQRWAKPRFNDKVHHVVWHQLIVAGCWRHFDVRKRRSLYVYSVTSLSTALKLEKHNFIKPRVVGGQCVLA